MRKRFDEIEERASEQRRRASEKESIASSRRSTSLSYRSSLSSASGHKSPSSSTQQACSKEKPILLFGKRQERFPLSRNPHLQERRHSPERVPQVRGQLREALPLLGEVQESVFSRGRVGEVEHELLDGDGGHYRRGSFENSEMFDRRRFRCSFVILLSLLLLSFLAASCGGSTGTENEESVFFALRSKRRAKERGKTKLLSINELKRTKKNESAKTEAGKKNSTFFFVLQNHSGGARASSSALIAAREAGD